MSISKNFSYNLLLTFCNYLFPILTYPYISRVLGVVNIGVCNFVDSIIDYFILFSMLGVGSYGVREIARCKDDIARRNNVFTNLFLINVFLTTCSILVLALCIIYVPQLQEYRKFLGIGIFKIVFNLFLIEWFFQGIEQFKYITIRSVFVRLAYVIAIFIFVKSESDTSVYYLLTVLVIVVNALLNWSYSRRFRNFNFKSISVGAYIIPIAIFGYYRVLTSMYTTFNTTFLGFSSGEMEVGYFTTACKLYTIILSVFTAFTTVMIPRVSVMLENKEINALMRVSNKTFEGLFAVACPMIVFCIVYASQIIFLISGSGYEGAVIPFKIVISLLLVIGMEQIVIQQFLMALQTNKPVLWVSTIGAIVGLSFNILLTPKLGAIGSAIAWVLSEIAVLFTGIKLMRKYIGFYFEDKILGRLFLCGAVYALISLSFSFLFSSWIAFTLSLLGCIISFFIFYVFVFKDSVVYSTFVSLSTMLARHK